MAHRNGTAPTYSPYSDWFEDWSDDQIALFIHSTRSYAMEPHLAACLADAADIAGRLAGVELSQREEEQRRAQVEIDAEIDAQREYAALCKLRVDMPDFSADEAPF